MRKKSFKLIATIFSIASLFVPSFGLAAPARNTVRVINLNELNEDSENRVVDWDEYGNPVEKIVDLDAESEQSSGRIEPIVDLDALAEQKWLNADPSVDESSDSDIQEVSESDPTDDFVEEVVDENIEDFSEDDTLTEDSIDKRDASQSTGTSVPSTKTDAHQQPKSESAVTPSDQSNTSTIQERPVSGMEQLPNTSTESSGFNNDEANSVSVDADGNPLTDDEGNPLSGFDIPSDTDVAVQEAESPHIETRQFAANETLLRVFVSRKDNSLCDFLYVREGEEQTYHKDGQPLDFKVTHLPALPDRGIQAGTAFVLEGDSVIGGKAGYIVQPNHVMTLETDYYFVAFEFGPFPVINGFSSPPPQNGGLHVVNGSGQFYPDDDNFIRITVEDKNQSRCKESNLCSSSFGVRVGGRAVFALDAANGIYFNINDVSIEGDFVSFDFTLSNDDDGTRMVAFQRGKDFEFDVDNYTVKVVAGNKKAMSKKNK